MWRLAMKNKCNEKCVNFEDNTDTCKTCSLNRFFSDNFERKLDEIYRVYNRDTGIFKIFTNIGDALEELNREFGNTMKTFKEVIKQ